MDNSYPNHEPGNHPQVDTKRVLLRFAVLLLVLLTTHLLILWLHPMGAHRFFWNLALGALSFWVLLRLVMPHLKDKSPELDRHQGLHR